MRCLIIHNPASGPSSDEIFAFTHALAQGGDEVVMRFIGDGMEPEDAVADVREFDRVVISGGDGTVSNVLDQMRGCGVPTLVFPSGTACLFFNNIGNAPRPRRSPRPAASAAPSRRIWVSSFGSTRTATKSATASSSSPARATMPRS